MQVQSLAVFRQSLRAAHIKRLEERTSDESCYGGIAIKPEKFPPGYTSAALTWNYLGLVLNTQMNGGFFACAQNPKTFALEPAIGWCVTEGEFTLAKSTTAFYDSESEEEESEEEDDDEKDDDEEDDDEEDDDEEDGEAEEEKYNKCGSFKS